jgi:hypothetical protein
VISQDVLEYFESYGINIFINHSVMEVLVIDERMKMFKGYDADSLMRIQEVMDRRGVWSYGLLIEVHWVFKFHKA